MPAPPVTLPNQPSDPFAPAPTRAQPGAAAPAVLAPTYYLDNFQRVLDWVEQRYADLLAPSEQAFITAFRALPLAARALLVRMVMRKGELFRASRLQYEEIGDPLDAVAPLVALGWVETAPAFDLATLFALFTKAELAARYPALARTPKAALLAQLQAEADAPAAPSQPLAAWLPEHGDTVVRIAVLALCERLRVMFFGNGHQDWTEFILADLGIWRYEQVAFTPASRSFQQRRDIDDYLFLQDWRARFEAGAAPAELVQALPAEPYANAWLEARRSALLFQLARHCERSAELEQALALYRACGQRGARARMIRVLELLGQYAAALALAEQADAAPHDHAEAQQVARMLPRLRRQNGLATKAERGAAAAAATERIALRRPCPIEPCAVEEVAREALGTADAPVFYVENALVNSLFGLLCWDVVFLPLPGAFFHPFHSGPVDLFAPDFAQRRASGFAARLAEFDDGRYLATIRANFAAKSGIVSPFVYWDVLDADLLELALHCIPAAHLKHWCERLLADLAANRSGFPDLIQFWPAERRYRMIEVKGPGDRLQDNQLRLLAFCAQHAMPAAVCYVEWSAP